MPPVLVTVVAFNAPLTGIVDAADEAHSPLVLMIDPEADSNPERAKRLLHTGKYKTQKELAAAFGMQQPAMSKILSSAVAQGVLKPDEAKMYYQRARDASSVDVDSVCQDTSSDF